MVRAFMGGKELRKEDCGKHVVKLRNLDRLPAEKKCVNTTDKKRA